MPRPEAELRERLLRSLARKHGGMLNRRRLASALEISAAELSRQLARLEADGEIRLLAPCRGRHGRGTRAEKVYVSHPQRLRELQSAGVSFGRPEARRRKGAEWEGRVIESLLEVAPAATRACHFRDDRSGSEMDLVLQFPETGERWAIEIKLDVRTRLGRSFHSARRALCPDRAFLVHSGSERFEVMDGVEALGLRDMRRLVKMGCGGKRSRKGSG